MDQVHIFLYHWCTDDDERTEVISAHHDYDAACRAMHTFMDNKRCELEADGYEDFHEDFDNDTKSYVSFGFYALIDHKWVGTVETMPVE